MPSPSDHKPDKDESPRPALRKVQNTSSQLATAMELPFTFVAAGGQVGTEKPRPSGATYLAALFRYVLLGFAVYVIFNYLHVPLVSIVLGLCAFAAATITASVWEILQPVE